MGISLSQMARVFVFAAVCVLAVVSGVTFESDDNMMVMEEASPTFFLQIESGGEKFVEVPSENIPISTTTIKTTTASKAECETACNKAPLCKGYKHTNGSNQCTLLGHQIAAPGSAAAPGAAAAPAAAPAAPAAVDPSIAIAAAAQKAQDEAKKEGKADREKAANAIKDSEEKKAEAKTEMKAAEDAKAQVEAQASALKQEKKGVRKAEAKAEE